MSQLTHFVFLPFFLLPFSSRKLSIPIILFYVGACLGLVFLLITAEEDLVVQSLPPQNAINQYE